MSILQNFKQNLKPFNNLLEIGILRIACFQVTVSQW